MNRYLKSLLSGVLAVSIMLFSFGMSVPGSVPEAKAAKVNNAEALGKVTDLGAQVGTVRVNMGDFGKDKDGKNVGYTVVTGSPSQFIVFDIKDGKELKKVPLPNTEGSWEIFTASDGTVYIGGYNEGILFRYFPDTETITTLGKPLEGYNPVLYKIVEDKNGILYGGSYGTGCLYSYDPKVNKFTNLGALAEGGQYVRSLAYDVVTDRLYAGVSGKGISPLLIVYDLKTGEKRNIIPQKYTNITSIYDLKLVDRKLFCRKETGHAMFVIDIDTETLIEAENMETGVISSDISCDMRHPSDKSPLGDYVFFGDMQALYCYDLTTDTYSKIGNYLPGGALRWKILQLDESEYPGYTLVAQMSNQGAFYKYNLTTGKDQSFVLGLSPQPVAINSLTKGPDGRIYSGGSLGGGMGAYDPITGQHSFLYGVSQVEGMTDYGDDKLYIGTYNKAVILEYDMWNPWNRVGASTPNPRFLFNMYDNMLIPQDRPYNMLGITDYNKVAIATVPTIGKYGGALAFYDVSAGQKDIFWNVVPDQTIASMAYKDGLLYLGTTVQPGYNTAPKATEAVLAIWDVKNMQKVYEIKPVAEKTDITALMVGPDGNIWGAANDTLFIFDVEKREIAYSAPKFPATSKYFWRDICLVQGNDGFIYGISSRSKIFFRLNPNDKEVELLLEDAGQFLAQDDFGSFYFAKGTNLYKYSDEKLLAKPKGASIEVEKSEIVKGETLKMRVKGFMGKNGVIRNLILSGAKLQYHTSDPAVVEVSDGVITAIGYGHAQVWVEAEINGEKLKSEKVKIYVVEDPNKVE